MNFELKTLSLASAAKSASEVLIVLISDQFQAAKDPLSLLIEKAIKAKDFSSKTGKVLHAYAAPGVSATKLVFLGVGAAKAVDMRSAMTGLTASLKAAETKKLTVVSPESLSASSMQALLVALAEGTYVYGTTKSKPATRALTQVSLGLPSVNLSLQNALKATVGMIQGIEFAKEWANRPANHATPTMLAKAAMALAKSGAMSCEVLGPKEVAKLGMGSFMAVAQGSAEPLRFIVLKLSLIHI